MVADDLRNDYMKSRYSVDVDEWPPNQPKTVVNVALIHYKGSRTEQELIEISKRHKEGTQAVDELAHHSRVTTDIAKIFAAGFNDSTETGATSGKPPNFILIEGAPGIGKTVLAKRIAYLWAIKELLTDTNILFLLYLRDPELQNIKTPEQLIQYLSSKRLDEEQVKSCVTQIMELKVGIVMDGFDEYPIKLRKISFIANLIKGKVFHNCIVVLTSRPTATISLHDKVDRRVEILGFAQEERDQYIFDSLDSPEQRRQLQDYLKCQPIINGLIYVPLHLAVLLYLFKRESKLPETLTEMNNSFTIHTIYRSMTKNDLTTPGVVTVVDDLKDLPKTVSDILKKLSKLALVGLQNNQLVFTYAEIKANCAEIENDIPGACNGFGLLQVVQYLPNKGAGVTVSFNFLHFTMQEFLAAFHMSNSIPPKQQLRLMKETFWSNTYNFMWMMYIGINGINSQVFLQFLYKAHAGADIKKLTLSDNIKTNNLKCLHLFQCFMEAKSKEVPKEISSIFGNNFHGVQLLPYHISSVILYISKYCTQLQSLNLRDCHIGDVGMNILQHFFTVNPDKASSIKHIDLFGNNSVLLWNVYCAIFGQQNLTKLNWSLLGGINIEEIVNVMNDNMTVQSLNLSGNHFNDNDAEKIAKMLLNNTVLEELDLSHNNISIKGAIAISESLKYNTTLQYLKMPWNNQFIDTCYSALDLSQKGMKIVDIQIMAKVLFNNKTVVELKLSQNKISDDCALCISECIQNNKTLTKLDLSMNKISDLGLKRIVPALYVNQSLQKFDVSHNNISDDGAAAISQYLENNDTLQELSMSYNKISNSGILCIGQALQLNKILQIFDISYNNISDDGMITFSNYLKVNNTLQELRISWNDGSCLVVNCMDMSCNIREMNCGDNGAVIISAFLYSNNKVQKLDVSCNHIANKGTVAISDFLKNNINTLQVLNVSHNEISNQGIVNIIKALQINTTLQILDISHNNLSDYAALLFSDYLKGKNTIQELNMSHNKVSNNGILSIAKALQANNSLQMFDISHNKLSCSGVVDFSECLKDNRTLQKLRMSWINGNDLLLDSTEQFYSMCKMSFSNTEVILISAFLYHNTNLQQLDLSDNRICDDGAVAISECLKNNGTLQELNISHNKVSDNGIVNIGEALQRNTSLQILDISHNNLSNNIIFIFSNYLKEENTLHQLRISWNNIDLDLNFNVTSLNMSSIMNWMFGNTEAILGFTLLDYYTNIEKFNISHNNISDDGAVAIGECLKNNNTLRELNLSHNKVSDNGIISIGNALEMNAKLQMFNISYNNISDDGAVAISECLKNNNTLRELNLSHNKISDSGIISIGNALEMNTKLQIFNISCSNISDDGAVAISECLKNNNTLQELNISHNKISDSGIISIGNALEMNTKLQIFNISYNNISDDGAVAISECLKNNSTLQELNMSHNKVSDDGIIYIAKALQINVTLQILDVSHNSLSDNGVVTFSDYLKEKNALHQLRISWNDIDLVINFNVTSLIICGGLTYQKNISNTGAILVSDFLYCNANILKLEISYNDVSDDGAVAISECLKTNNTLQELNMSHNKVSDSGIISIDKALEMNAKLQIFNISYNNISDDGAVAISECLKNNSTL